MNNKPKSKTVRRGTPEQCGKYAAKNKTTEEHSKHLIEQTEDWLITKQRCIDSIKKAVINSKKHDRVFA